MKSISKLIIGTSRTRKARLVFPSNIMRKPFVSLKSSFKSFSTLNHKKDKEDDILSKKLTCIQGMMFDHIQEEAHRKLIEIQRKKDAELERIKYDQALHLKIVEKSTEFANKIFLQFKDEFLNLEKSNIIMRIAMCNKSPLEFGYTIFSKNDGYLEKDRMDQRLVLETTKVLLNQYFKNHLQVKCYLYQQKYRNLGGFESDGEFSIIIAIPFDFSMPLQKI